MKKLLLIVAAVIVVAAVIGSQHKGSGSSGAPASSESGFDQAYGAIVDAPKWPNLRDKCTENPSDLIRELMNTYKLEKKDGIGESYAALVAHVNLSIPPVAAPTKCDQMMAAYVTLRDPNG